MKWLRLPKPHLQPSSSWNPKPPASRCCKNKCLTWPRWFMNCYLLTRNVVTLTPALRTPLVATVASLATCSQLRLRTNPSPVNKKLYCRSQRRQRKRGRRKIRMRSCSGRLRSLWGRVGTVRMGRWAYTGLISSVHRIRILIPEAPAKAKDECRTPSTSPTPHLKPNIQRCCSPATCVLAQATTRPRWPTPGTPWRTHSPVSRTSSLRTRRLLC